MKKIKFNNKFIIVMYHHISNDTKYLNAIDPIKFERQISFFKKNFNVLSPNKFYEKIKKNKFDSRDCLLTFDDGYQSHYKYAFKILKKYNLKGFFFPMVYNPKPNYIHHLNKIQLFLKINKDKMKILDEIKDKIRLENPKFFKKLNKILDGIKTKNFYDSKIEIIIKRLLQRELPIKLREKICNDLFRRTKIPNKITNKFYMSTYQIKKLSSLGHEIGIHTNTHYWMSHLKKNEQRREVLKSLRYMKSKKLIKKDWTFCYPFGDYNKFTIEILKKINCKAAFTVKNQPMPLKKFKKFELKRLDCNYFL